MYTYKYHLEKSVIDDKEEVSLIRIKMLHGAGIEGEEYFNGKWHPYHGALSYLPDPSPGDFIDEQEAKEVMKQLDQRDGVS
jgi:hypothetical protein